MLTARLVNGGLEVNMENAEIASAILDFVLRDITTSEVVRFVVLDAVRRGWCALREKPRESKAG